MSYPRHIQALIVEDEQVPTENYRKLFEELANKKVDVAPPVFARSHEDAVKLLSGDSIFHLVIVDLNLPPTTDEVAQPGVEHGIDLVQRAAVRDQYPVPALLVISGRLGQARLPELINSLQRDFWHGQMVNKGFDQDEAIEFAVQKAHDYCDVGIHLRDAEGKLCPTLSPREEDLLRRCVLGQPHCIGVDIEWWGSPVGISVTTSQIDTKKILVGRFLLKDGKGLSRPSFFKFEATDSATYSHGDAAVMVQKLSHVKMCSTVRGLRRSLLVTQQVGNSSDHPISLGELLATPSAAAFQAIPQIVSEIVDQLAKLGESTADRFPVSALLWKWHDPKRIELAYIRYEGLPGAGPLCLLEQLRHCGELVLVQRQSCTHGDLNATNVAIEEVDHSYHAYIFDAEGIHADTAVRDLAMLEVTALLYQNVMLDGGLVENCQAVYTKGMSLPDLPAENVHPIVRNTFHLIREIRRNALQSTDISVYALMIFDCAMLQLGGLAVQSRANKIANPHNAVRLVDLAAHWVTSVAPTLVQKPKVSPTGF